MDPEEIEEVVEVQSDYDRDRDAVAKIAAARDSIRHELAKIIVGQEDVIDEMLIALLSGGHCLITGAPGLAKTLLVKSLADVFHLSFNRIQFTPDLMPADIFRRRQDSDGALRGLAVDHRHIPRAQDIDAVDRLAGLQQAGEIHLKCAGKVPQCCNCGRAFPPFDLAHH